MTTNRHIFGTISALAALACLGAPAYASASTLLSGYGGPGVGNQAILGSALIGGPSGGGPSGGSGAVSGQAISETNSLQPQSSSPAGGSSAGSSRTSAHHRSAARAGREGLVPGRATDASGAAGRNYYVRARDVSQPLLGFSGSRLGLLILGLAVLVLTGAAMRRLLAVGATNPRASQGATDITRLTPE